MNTTNFKIYIFSLISFNIISSIYSSIITTRTYEDRLNTLANVRDAGINVCCGGIVGMGEGADDRVGMITALATLHQHPESVPINMLVQVEGTPLARGEALDELDFVRTVAVARITMPACERATYMCIIRCD